MRRAPYACATSGSSPSSRPIANTATAVSAQQPEAVSLLGKLLVPHEPSGDMRAALEANLASARAAHEKDPHDAGAAIALGRATAELGRYHEAIEILTMGVEAHADE